MDSAVRESGKRYGLYGLRRSLNTETDNDNDNDKFTPGRDEKVVGIFARSLHDLSLIAESTFPPAGRGSSGDSPVKRIVYLDYAKNQKLEYAMDVFISALEQHLKVERTTVKLDEEWERYRVDNGLDWSLSKVSPDVFFCFSPSFTSLWHMHDYGRCSWSSLT